MNKFQCFFYLVTAFLFGVPLNSLAQKMDADKYSYGIKMGLNYTTIGATSGTYSGEVMPNLGMFWANKINDHLTFSLEPGFSSVRFRQQQADTRYNTNYIDVGFNAIIYPSIVSKDFAIILGIRPSALVSYSTEKFVTGNYENDNDSTNFNFNGRIDLTGTIGVSVALSPVISLDVLYNQGFTANNSDFRIEGRASTFEIGLRLNAVSLRDQVSKSQQTTRELIEHYNKGVLLVMLPTLNPSEVKVIMKDSNIDELTSMQVELSLRNTLVIQRFRQNFNFCPVYFFMDTSIHQILSKNFKGAFVNDNMQPDSGIEVDTANFFISSFCVDNSNYTHKMHFGLYVYNEEMIQLDKPFNHPVNLVSEMVEGDPILFVTRKRTKYSKSDFTRIVSKFNTRLMRYIN